MLGLALSAGAGCNSDNFRVKPFISPTFDYQSSLSRVEIKNVPESLRYAPIHPDDTYATESNNGVIQDDSIKLRRLSEIGLLKAGIETRLWDTSLDVYWKGSFRLKDEDESLSRHGQWKKLY